MKAYSKKAQVNPFLLGIAALFIVGLLFLLTVIGTNNLLLTEVNNLVQDSDFSAAAKQSSQDLANRNNTAWDNAFALLTGGIAVCMFFAGFTLNRSPVVLIFTFIIIFIATYAGFHIVNVYEDLATETQGDIDFEANFPKAHLIMSNLLVVIITCVLLLGLGVYVGNRVEI